MQSHFSFVKFDTNVLRDTGEVSGNTLGQNVALQHLGLLAQGHGIPPRILAGFPIGVDDLRGIVPERTNSVRYPLSSLNGEQIEFIHKQP